MLNEVFSDYFAHKDNFLTRIDARLKIVFIIGDILITVASAAPLGPMIVFILVTISLLSIKIPLGLIMLRLTAPLGLGLAVLFMQIFFYGSTPLFRLDLAGFHLTAFLEGWNRGLLIMSRIIGATALVLFLSLTTPLNRLVTAAAWFRVPKTWVEICLFTYRYVFVLLDDAITVMDAQRVRMGYTNLARALRSLGNLAGIIVLRAYDQSLRTCEAMILRGYQGQMPVFSAGKFKLKDGIAAFIFSLVLAGLLTLSWR